MDSVLVFGHFDLFLAKESIRKKTFVDTILALGSHLRGNLIEKCPNDQESIKY